MLTNVIICIGMFFLMEGVAWFTHKYIMHGILWKLHEDHHVKGEGQFFEKNDSFFLIFATPGILFLLFGSLQGFNAFFYMGLGITLYGIAYFFVHDIFIHQRFKLFRNSDNTYLRGIRKAHKVHHKKLIKEGCECFGMLWVPIRFFREARSLGTK